MLHAAVHDNYKQLLAVNLCQMLRLLSTLHECDALYHDECVKIGVKIHYRCEL